MIGESEYPTAFGQKKIGALAIDRLPGSKVQKPVVVQVGAGQFIYSPLPVELNERWEPIQALYTLALELSGTSGELEWLRGGELPGVYGRKLSFAAGSLYLFVSEFGSDAGLAVRDPESGAQYEFRLEQERTVMFAADRSGRLLAVYRPEEVKIHVLLRQEEPIKG
ncbi:hypothetical protein D3C73_1151360 [compost metagenome]